MSCLCFNCSYRNMVFNVNKDTELHRLVLCKKVNLNSIRELLKRGNINALDGHKDTPLHLAALNEENYEIVTELINAGAEVQIGNLTQNTPLHMAVLHRNRRITEVLLKSGSDVNSRNMLGDTPLHSVVKPSFYWKAEDRLKPHGKLIVKMLIQAGANINLPNKFNETPLFRAVEMGDFDIVQELLKSGANANICDYDSASCLHIALRKIHPDYKLIEELVRHGANINCKDKWFTTPLDLAIIRHIKDPLDELKTAKVLIKLAILVHPEESIDIESTYIRRADEESVVQDLYDFRSVCSTVVNQMKEFWITEDFSLYDFALRGINCTVINCNKLAGKIFSKVLLALLKENFDVYRDILECYFPKLYLKEVLMNIRIFGYNEINQREIELLRDVVWLICDYLDKIDIIQLIKASSIVESNNFIIAY